jgi:uncharacterized membrane protein
MAKRAEAARARAVDRLHHPQVFSSKIWAIEERHLVKEASDEGERPVEQDI